MKKILLISNKIMHYRVSVYNYFHKRFAEEGYEFSVIADKMQKENRFKPVFDFKEIPFKFSKYIDEIKKLRPDFVIIFLHIKDFIIWPLVYWLRMKKIPVIFWTKGANLDDPENFFRNVLFRKLHTLCDGLILYSPKEINFIMKKNRNKVSVANNTINFSDFPEVTESPEEIKKSLGINYRKIVLFVGRMGIGGERKKVDHLIKIFGEIDNPDYGLIIVGSGLSDSLKACINPKNTIYLGEIHDPEQVMISRIFKMSDLFVIPGHIGLGINQANFWGLPVITEEGKQPPEIQYLIDGVNGYIVKENDIVSLKEKMISLLENDNLRLKFSDESRKNIMKNGSTESMFGGFLESVKKLDK